MKIFYKYFLIIFIAFLIVAYQGCALAATNYSQKQTATTNQKSYNNYNQKNINNIYENNNTEDDENRVYNNNYGRQNNITDAQIVENPLEDLSKIEKEINEDLTSESILYQVGYNFFAHTPPLSAGKYDDNYVLNIGEKVNVYIWGTSIDVLTMANGNLLSPVTKTLVDTKGFVFVPGVGLVRAEGKTLSEVESSIQKTASSKFSNIKVKVTVADATEFPIFIYGNVVNPGKVTVGANSSIIEALALAGGVTKSGSLRNITITSGGKTYNLDLYKIVLLGKGSDVKLKYNDKIFVNNIGPVITMQDGVKIPGIYELTKGDNVDSMINYAGGFTPSTSSKTVNVKTFDPVSDQRISKDILAVDFKQTLLRNGDIIQFNPKYGKAENIVSIEGNVKFPRTMQYKQGMRLSDILKSKNDILDETFLSQAVIKRYVGDSKQLTTVSVSLKEFFAGSVNPLLKPKDVIIILKNTSNSYIEVYGCINTPKYVPYYDKLTLKDIMAGLKFIETGVDNIKNVNNVIKPAEIDKDAKNNNTQKVALSTVVYSKMIPAENIAVEISNKNSNEVQTYYLYDILVHHDVLSTILINPDDKVFFRPLREDEILKTVKISGFVNTPGVYTFVEGKKLTDMIELAGGLVPNADLRGIVYTRTKIAEDQEKAVKKQNEKDIKLLQSLMSSSIDTSGKGSESKGKLAEDLRKETENLAGKFDGRISLKIENNDLSQVDEYNNILVQDGDSIYIPKMSNHVMVIGEVYNETSFVYKKGENYHYYIKQVGGYTEAARRTKIYRVSVNGNAYKYRMFGDKNVYPGDILIVPKKVKGNDWIDPVTKALQSVANTAMAVFCIIKLK